MIRVKAIVGMASNRVIGIKNQLPWHIPADLARFKSLTTGHTVVMGRKTYESLPERVRPLPDRFNVVISRNWSASDVPDGVLVVDEPEAWVQAVKSGEVPIQGDTLWVLGGEKIYKILLPLCDELHLTRVHQSYTGDAFFPEFENDFRRLAVEGGDGYSFEHFVRS